MVTNMKKQGRSIEFFTARCRQHNLRITLQRTAIYKAIKDDSSHPSADIVYNKIKATYPNISFDTVNRTLLSFVDIGVLNIAESYNRQKRFDPNLKRHHHLSCIKCGKIIDFVNKDYDELKTPNNIKNKYKVLGWRVVIECICDTCSGKNKRGGWK
jgi:Fur family peroxide stress response transcriptional regulator